jgi:hypothetical protein
VAGSLALVLLMLWQLALPWLMEGEPNFEGLIVGVSLLGWPAAKALAAMDALHYLLKWLALCLTIPLEWALVGGLVAAAHAVVTGRRPSHD